MVQISLFALILGSPFSDLAMAKDTQNLSDAAATQDALVQTKTLLRSRAKRNAYINENKEARQADTAAKMISDNPRHTDEIYDISADIMDQIVKETDGDVMKMQELLIKAAANPRAFHHRLSPKHKARIRSLASEIEKDKGK